MKNVLMIILAGVISNHSFAQSKVEIGAGQEIVYPLELNSPDVYGDLDKFKEVFAGREVVGMGEATHGTKEFFEYKAKTFKFLVTNYNYKVFGIEASYGGCSYINDFIQSGVGNIDSVLLYFDFWTWRTAEVKDLIRWMKEYNQGKSDAEKLRFYGYDMQNFYSPVAYLNAHFKADATVNYPELKDILYPVLGKTELQIYYRLKDKKLKFQDTLGSVYVLMKDWMQRHKDLITSHYSVRQFEKLNFCVDNYGQAVRNLHGSYNFRDSCMAFNVLKIKEIEQAKMFVWAHNGHINLSYPDKVSTLMGLPMGGYLKEALGEKYYSIGFVFNRGSFQAVKGPNSIGGAVFKYFFARKKLYRGLQECTVPAYKRNTLTNMLSGAGLNAFFVDLTHSRNPAFSAPQSTYDIGAVFLNYKRCSDTLTAKKQFQGLIYIDKTSRTMPVK